jgi:hypothetical protein
VKAKLALVAERHRRAIEIGIVGCRIRNKSTLSKAERA